MGVEWPPRIPTAIMLLTAHAHSLERQDLTPGPLGGVLAPSALTSP